MKECGEIVSGIGEALAFFPCCFGLAAVFTLRHLIRHQVLFTAATLWFQPAFPPSKLCRKTPAPGALLHLLVGREGRRRGQPLVLSTVGLHHLPKACGL